MRNPVFGFVFTCCLLSPSENWPQISFPVVFAWRAVMSVMWGSPAGLTVAMRPTLASGSNSLRSFYGKLVSIFFVLDNSHPLAVSFFRR